MNENIFNLTKREVDVLNALWAANRPIVASEVTKVNPCLSINTIQSILKKLLSKELIKVADIVTSGTVLSRAYVPIYTADEYIVKQIAHTFSLSKKKVPTLKILSHFLDESDDEEGCIKELQIFLKKRERDRGIK